VHGKVEKMVMDTWGSRMEFTRKSAMSTCRPASLPLVLKTRRRAASRTRIPAVYMSSLPWWSMLATQSRGRKDTKSRLDAASSCVRPLKAGPNCTSMVTDSEPRIWEYLRAKSRGKSWLVWWRG
jgi:hypothetical protein